MLLSIPQRDRTRPNYQPQVWTAPRFGNSAIKRFVKMPLKLWPWNSSLTSHTIEVDAGSWWMTASGSDLWLCLGLRWLLKERGLHCINTYGIPGGTMSLNESDKQRGQKKLEIIIKAVKKPPHVYLKNAGDVRNYSLERMQRGKNLLSPLPQKSPNPAPSGGASNRHHPCRTKICTWDTAL